MRAIIIREPAGLNNLNMTTLPDPGKPGSGEILVRLRASSLNYHDYAVVHGAIKTSDGRIPLSDGAGEVVGLMAESAGRVLKEYLATASMVVRGSLQCCLPALSHMSRRVTRTPRLQH